MKGINISNNLNSLKKLLGKAKGFPVFASLYDSAGKLITCSGNNSAKGQSKNTTQRHTNHGEGIMEVPSGINTDECYMIITFPPCIDCLKRLEDLGIKKVYFLFDPYNKANRKTGKESVVEFEKIDIKHDFIDYNKCLLVNKYLTKGHKRSRLNLQRKFGKLSKAFK